MIFPYWLVGGIPTPLKNDGVKVSWDDFSFPTEWKVKKNHVPNHKPAYSCAKPQQIAIYLLICLPIFSHLFSHSMKLRYYSRACMYVNFNLSTGSLENNLRSHGEIMVPSSFK